MSRTKHKTLTLVFQESSSGCWRTKGCGDITSAAHYLRALHWHHQTYWWIERTAIGVAVTQVTPASSYRAKTLLHKTTVPVPQELADLSDLELAIRFAA